MTFLQSAVATRRLHRKLTSASTLVQRFTLVARACANSTSSQSPNGGPLAGIKVLELGHLIAAPFCGFLLAYYGADVIKVEAPGKGDPLRVWRELDVDGVSPWFRSLARNKKSVTIDLRQEKGRELVRQLALQSDVLLENFKPGRIERWGLGPSDLHPQNPGLIYTRVSGYGQTGPMRSVGGYASVCEAFSGFRFINGFPDEHGRPAGAPVRPNISLGDSLAGLHAAFGTVMALLARGKAAPGSKTGQTVDVAIYESVMAMLEGIIPAYDRFGVVRGPSGSSVTGIVPTNVYVTKDPSTYIIIGANGDSIYNRLMTKIGRQDLIGDEFRNNDDRVRNQETIENAITAWTSQISADDALQALAEAEVPSGRINSVEDRESHA
ncbi:CoA-transferase family III [Tilletiaria anomala UBC 951]|uniref:CoA-transferase family III n=1 Tax=Tilletiaria anomala (strain ATCC 24038 / CBS 436.72 / UBC 951) TaxID=1037660 RepID=A0A066W9I7_TILAU|nr:CoA-transferase family III [Tilletiaria anomala UBC 951]KDN49218.1 CoA-transferase family III [Tilletiaria anomala UBC 951]